MKKIIVTIAGSLSICAMIYRAFWLLDDRLLGIETNHKDFSRWIHGDLKCIHDHLDEPLENLKEHEQVYSKLILHKKVWSNYNKLKNKMLKISVFYRNKERIEIGDNVKIVSHIAMHPFDGKTGTVKFIEGGWNIDTGTELISCWSECYYLKKIPAAQKGNDDDN